MLHRSIEILAEDTKSALGLTHVFTCHENGINTEFVNYGYIRSLTDREAKMFSYRMSEDSCGYDVMGEYVFVADLCNCSDVKMTHDKIVSWFMNQACVDVLSSGYDATAIFMNETESSNYWESDNQLIAVWFTYQDESNSCNIQNNDYCIV